MNEINLFENLADDALKIFNDFIEINPLGSIVLNDQFEVIHINAQMKQYFENDVNLSDNFFGNIFSCNQIEGTKSFCGTTNQCKNCNLRNKVIESMETKNTIRNILWSNKFILHNKIITKWFDITLVPLMIGKMSVLWVSMMDLTELMSYKIEHEMTHIMTDEERTIEKSNFNEHVMDYIKTNCHSGGIAYMVLIDLKTVSLIQEKFGSLWKSDYVTTVFQYMKEVLGDEDLICQYSVEQFLLFLPHKGHDTLSKIVSSINDYKSSIFSTDELIVTRTLKVEIASDYVQKIVKEDILYLDYFKAISKLEQLKENEIYDVVV